LVPFLPWGGRSPELGKSERCPETLVFAGHIKKAMFVPGSAESPCCGDYLPCVSGYDLNRPALIQPQVIAL